MTKNRTYFNSKKISEEEKGYLVGFFVGDGYVKKGRIVIFALSDEDVKKGIDAKLKQIISKSGKRFWICKQRKSIQVVTASKDLVLYLKSVLNYIPGNKAKTVYLKMVHHSKPFLRGFLGSLIDSDGSVGTSAFCCTISRRLKNQIRKITNYLRIRTTLFEHFTSEGNKAFRITLRNSDLKKNPIPSIKLDLTSWFHKRRREDLWLLDVVKDLPEEFNFSEVVKVTNARPNLIWILLNYRLIKRGYLVKVRRGIYKKRRDIKI